MFSIIAATCRSGAIGKSGNLIHNVKEDLQFFRRLTIGHTVIVGRKTYESIPNRLMGRRVIVITSNKNYHCDIRDDIIIAENFDQAIAIAKDEEEVFIIGGTQVYRSAMKMADKIYLTLFNDFCGGDAFFPSIYWNSEWKVVDQTDFCNSNGLEYQRFVLLREKNNKK